MRKKINDTSSIPNTKIFLLLRRLVGMCYPISDDAPNSVAKYNNLIVDNVSLKIYNVFLDDNEANSAAEVLLEKMNVWSGNSCAEGSETRDPTKPYEPPSWECSNRQLHRRQPVERGYKRCSLKTLRN